MIGDLKQKIRSIAHIQESVREILIDEIMDDIATIACIGLAPIGWRRLDDGGAWVTTYMPTVARIWQEQGCQIEVLHLGIQAAPISAGDGRVK